MLSCEETKNLLSAYYDGELGVAAANEVAEHLALCESCQKACDDMSFLSGAIASVEYPEIDEKFSEALSDKLLEASKAIKTKGFGVWVSKMRPYIAAAACFVLVAGVYAIVHDGNYLTNTKQSEPMILNLQTDQIQNDISSEDTKMMQPSNANDDNTEKENTDIAKAGQKKTYVAQPSQEKKDADLSSENADNIQLIRVLDEDESEKNNQINARAIAKDEVDEKKTNQLPESETIKPTPSQTPVDENDILPEKEISHGGGGASSSQTKPVMTQLILLDKTEIDAIKDIIHNYGTYDINERYIHLTVLSANYDACIEVLSGLDCIEVLKTEKNADSEYCYIQIDIQKSAEQ